MIGFSKRGLRNNNPFNIKRSNQNWIGKVPFAKSSDTVFEQFSSMYYGLRAGMKLLVNYVNKGFDTPRKIVERFAPRSENATDNYIYFICRNSRGLAFIGADEHIGDLHTLCMLASRMVRFENSCSLTLLENIRCTPNDLEKLCNFYSLTLK